MKSLLVAYDFPPMGGGIARALGAKRSEIIFTSGGTEADNLAILGRARAITARDVPAAVVNLRAKPGGEIRVWGSTKLIRTLAEHDLIDEYRLAVYPLVLGTGKKLFSDGFALARLTLAESRALRSGVVVNTYRRSDAGRA